MIGKVLIFQSSLTFALGLVTYSICIKNKRPTQLYTHLQKKKKLEKIQATFQVAYKS